MQPSASYSMPINSPSQRPLMLPPPGPDDQDRLTLMRDIIQAKEELLRFRNEMDGLAEQIGDMEIDLVTFIFYFIFFSVWQANVVLFLLRAIIGLTCYNLILYIENSIRKTLKIVFVRIPKS